MLFREPLDEFLAVRVLAQEEDSRFAEGPFEMGVADLPAAVAQELAGRALLGLDESGVGQELVDPGKAVYSTQIGEPVPGEDALDRDDEIVPIRCHGTEKRLRRRLHILVQQHFSFSVEDAQVHGAGVQVDAAVVPMRLCVESH